MDTPVRRRQPRVQGATAPASTQQAPASGGRAPWLKRGAAAIAGAEQEKQRQEEKRQQGFSNRFWLKPGEEREIIVLDKSFNDAAAFFEHNLKDSNGRWGVHEGCVKEFANCPVCDKFGASYYVIMLSVLDLTEYDRKDKQTGKVKEHVTQTKRLLPIKTSNLQTWRQLEQAAIKNHGTMRGMYVVLSREKKDQSPRIGEPVIQDNGMMFQFYDEDQLVAEFGHDEVRGRDGKVLRPKNFDLIPYDYDKLFPQPDPEKLVQKYGAAPTPGSAKEVVDSWGDQNQQPEAPAAGGTRTRRRPVEQQAEQPAADAPVRRRRIQAEAPPEDEDAFAGQEA